MRRPTWTLCTAAIIAGTVAGSVHYLSARPRAYFGGPVITLETSPTASVSQPPARVTALFAITDWISKLIDQKFGSLARVAKAILAGLIVASAVLIAGGILVAVGAAISLPAVVVLAVVAGLVAGAIVYALERGGSQGGSQRSPDGGNGPKPPPFRDDRLRDDVFLRVSWEPEKEKRGYAKHLFVYLDWRSSKKNGKQDARAVTGNDFSQWEKALKAALREVKDDLSKQELEKNSVQVDIFPDPGSETLNTVKKLIRDVFGKEVDIYESAPEQAEPQRQKSR